MASLLSDLPAHLGTGWQCVDIAVRALRIALRSTDFQKMPTVVAVLQSVLNTLNQLVTSYTKGSSGVAGAPEPRGESSATAGASTSADADSQPPADSSSDESGEQ